MDPKVVNHKRRPLRQAIKECEFRWFHETATLAQEGEAQQQALLGHMYTVGYGCKPNPDEAQKWFDEASKQLGYNVRTDPAPIMSYVGPPEGQPEAHRHHHRHHHHHHHNQSQDQQQQQQQQAQLQQQQAQQQQQPGGPGLGQASSSRQAQMAAAAAAAGSSHMFPPMPHPASLSASAAAAAAAAGASVTAG